MAQLRSLAFLITADRLAFITTIVISRTIASKRLFSTATRNGSTRRVWVSGDGVVSGDMRCSLVRFSADVDQQIAALVHRRTMAGAQQRGEGAGLEQARPRGGSRA